MAGKYVVRLIEGERERLRGLVAAGVAPARELAHARILLKADSGDGGTGWPDGRIAEALDSSPSTVMRVRRRYADEGLEAAVSRRRPRREYRRKIDGECEAQLIAVACGEAPEGRKGWTLRLYVSNGSSNGPALYKAANANWVEAAITGGDRPGRVGEIVANLGYSSAGAYREYDVTSVVAAGEGSFVLVPESSDGVNFHSKEGSNKPELVLIVDG